MKSLDQYWYSRNWVAITLLPLAMLFWVVSGLRRWSYRAGFKKTYKPPLPVIVIGNITVGGTGKSPLVAFLVKHLSDNGLKAGIVSRGYGGKAETWPQVVTPASDPRLVGDEAVMLANITRAPVVVSPNRAEAVESLCNKYDVDLILSDDGLQHYALSRSLEIIVVDGKRQFGNGWLLPSGPLRESLKRLEKSDLVIYSGIAPSDEAHSMSYQSPRCRTLKAGKEVSFDELKGDIVHAVAGIGDPQRFFDMLATLGLKVNGHAFPDHYQYSKGDLEFGDDKIVLMTEKDAVKCAHFGLDNIYVVSIEAQPDSAFLTKFDSKIQEVMCG